MLSKNVLYPEDPLEYVSRAENKVLRSKLDKLGIDSQVATLMAHLLALRRHFAKEDQFRLWQTANIQGAAIHWWWTHLRGLKPSCERVLRFEIDNSQTPFKLVEKPGPPRKPPEDISVIVEKMKRAYHKMATEYGPEIKALISEKNVVPQGPFS